MNATPSALHAEQAIAALERGLAVFCQKPLGRSSAEVRAVIAAAEAAHRLLAVDFSYRHTAIPPPRRWPNWFAAARSERFLSPISCFTTPTGRTSRGSTPRPSQAGGADGPRHPPCRPDPVAHRLPEGERRQCADVRRRQAARDQD
ncbi:Gfo/Idh/MocA family oxidoreductase [Erythrobacter sp. WG]|uniref:Gfo/Idh/MocA family oxidoreductase n=1 Tax=Erythrobacter sp. WG TaxID=2985510 RepID=UPI00226E72E9|nr:Gfo/Idh/MocA family oxidoreductase [Erythrobacter sp. WG]MCX9146072.1 Gfo/Idh/MocA family oxidoreductase [Erythrobacter sp. WG]